MVYGKTVCKGLFSDGIYICGMHFNWSVVSETKFYGHEHCNHIYSGDVYKRQDVRFTVVDVIGEEKVEQSKILAAQNGIPLRVRKYSP